MFSQDDILNNLPGMAGRRPRLLLVDDQPINIQLLHQIFAHDCQVFMATHGEQALRLCQEHLPDLMMLDVVMPGLDGFEVCQRLKADEDTRNIPVIFVTANDAAEQETRGLEAGAVDFITKPFNAAVVRARVKTHLALKLQSDILRELVYLDGLTGVYNRRHFDHQFGLEWSRFERTGSSLSVILIDVDHFKRYNDHYGHQSGDDVLRQLGKLLKQGMRRANDVVARYGGEEFACILPDTPFEDAMALAAQIETRVRALQIPHALCAPAGVVSISLGVSGVTGKADEATAEMLLSRADAELYRAKGAGRGRVYGAALPSAAS